MKLRMKEKITQIQSYIVEAMHFLFLYQKKRNKCLTDKRLNELVRLVEEL